MAGIEHRGAPGRREDPAAIVETLISAGFARRDVARIAGVSVASLRQIRAGGPVGAGVRAALERFADLFRQVCGTGRADPAGWFEIPIHPDAPPSPLDLVLAGRADLVEQAGRPGARPEQILDAYDSDWRRRYDSAFEVFRAEDGLLSMCTKPWV